MDNGAESYRRYLDGDDNGIVEIIQTYQDGLILFLNRYVHNIHDAEDLTEETFVKLVTKRPRYIPRYSFKTWLYTIGRNLAINHARRTPHGTVCDALERTPQEEQWDFERTLLAQERKLAVHRALDRLPLPYREALHLVYFEQMSHSEIGAVMKKNSRQVINLLYRAKQALRDALKKEGFVYEEL